MIRLAFTIMLLVLMIGGCVFDEKEKEPGFKASDLVASNLYMIYQYEGNSNRLKITGIVKNRYKKLVSDVSIVITVFTEENEIIGWRAAIPLP